MPAEHRREPRDKFRNIGIKIAQPRIGSLLSDLAGSNGLDKAISGVGNNGGNQLVLAYAFRSCLFSQSLGWMSPETCTDLPTGKTGEFLDGVKAPADAAVAGTNPLAIAELRSMGFGPWLPQILDSHVSRLSLCSLGDDTWEVGYMVASHCQGSVIGL